jgi:hypothetical protein
VGGVLPVLLAFPSAWPRSVDRVRHGAVICVCIFGSSLCGAHFASDGRPRHLVLRALYSVGYLYRSRGAIFDASRALLIVPWRTG